MLQSTAPDLFELPASKASISGPKVTLSASRKASVAAKSDWQAPVPASQLIKPNHDLAKKMVDLQTGNNPVQGGSTPKGTIATAPPEIPTLQASNDPVGPTLQKSSDPVGPTLQVSSDPEGPTLQNSNDPA